MTNSEVFKEYEDMLYAVKPIEWDSDMVLSNAMNHFSAFLNTHTKCVEPSVSAINAFISEFTYLQEELNDDSNKKQSRPNRVSFIKSKAIQLAGRIKQELEEKTVITYKSE